MEKAKSISRGVSFGAASSEGASDTLKMVGFKAMLCWHYIVLFSPILIAKTYPENYTTLFTRQFPLYVSLALTFGLLMLLGKRLIGQGRPSSKVLIAIGVYGVLATVFSVWIHPFDRPYRVLSVLLLGPAEGIAMFLWLRFYARAAEGHVLRSFAIDMMFGGVCAFLICSFTEPLSYVLAAALPLIAMISLDANWRHANTETAEASVDDGPSEKPQKTASLSFRVAAPRMLFAFVFGMMQGAFLFVNIPLMIVCDPVVIGCGIAVAGVIILFTSENMSHAAITDRMHRIALLLFGFGLIGLIVIRNTDLGSFALLLFEMLILAGFNLVDFGGLVTSYVLKTRVKGDAVTYVDSGRVLAYVGLALGLFVGYVIPRTVDMNIDALLIMLCCAGLMILMVVVLLPAPRTEASSVAASLTAGEKEQLIGTGGCAGCPAQGEAALHSRPSSEGAQGGLAPHDGATDFAVAPDGASADEQAERAASEDATSGKHPSSGASGDAGAPVAGRRVSWSTTCEHVADLYGLSRRERDVFTLIAKGRNAEFIQNELFISVHTVKTHMSHIYRKLGVHSSQELISLIEEYQQELSK